MKRLASVVAVTIVSHSLELLAGSNAWWKASGGGDMSDTTNYTYDGGATSPSDAAVVRIADDGGTTLNLTLGEDLTCPYLLFSKCLDVTFDLAPHTLSLTSGMSMQLGGAGSRYLVKSGTIGQKGKSVRWYSGCDNIVFTVDGPQTTFEQDAVFWYSTGSSFILTNGATMVGYPQVGGYTNNTVIITGPGTAVNVQAHVWHPDSPSDMAKYSVGTAANLHPTIIVDDHAVVTNITTFAFGKSGCGGELRISNGAWVDASSSGYAVYGDQDYATNNVLRVLSGGVFDIGGLAMGASGKNPVDNRIEVSGPGSLFRVGRTTKGSGLMIGRYVGADRNRVTVSDYGVLTNANAASFYVGYQANDCRMDVLSHGCVYSTDFYVGFGDAKELPAGSALVLDSYGKVELTGVLHFGQVSTIAGANVANDLLYVGDGAVLSCDRFRPRGGGNRLVISNGLFSAATELSTSYDAGGLGLNLVFAGTSPRLRLMNDSNTLGIHRGAKLTFDIPAEGYSTVPVSSARIKVDMTAGNPVSAEYHVEEYRKAGGGTLTLMSGPTTFTFGDDALAGFRATLPEKCELNLSSDKKSLLLKVKPIRGMMLFVR